MMKKLLFLLFIIFCFCPYGSHVLAQTTIYPGQSISDSTVFTFMPPDSLSHNTSLMGVITIDTAVTDTMETRLWQIGHTNKTYFADSGATKGIMTDTLNSYPVNANSWFTLHFSGHWLNPILAFTHKYQTTTGKDGGIVEFSLDNGTTWQNMKGACNADTGQWNSFPGVLTQNFYATTDTLYTGDMGFSGNSNGWVTSWFQFFSDLPVRTSNGGCNFSSQSEIQVRFRFISDSAADSLDGWLIGSLEVRADYYGGSVTKLDKQTTLSVYPNPSADAIFNFPVLNDEQDYNIEIINAIGARVMNIPYKHQVSLSGFAKGLYFYKVTNGVVHYTGQLITE